MELTLRRHGADDPELPAILDLIQTSFAYMDGVIDPPSSMHHLSLSDLQKQALNGEIWTLGPPLSACVLFTMTPKALYIGKLAVAAAARGQGLAQRLITHAARRAQDHNLTRLELQSRIELTDNHAAFTAMGFHETERSSHPGYSRPTSITFRRDLGPGPINIAPLVW